MDDLSQTQRDLIDETCVQEEARRKIAARRGITMHTFDNYRKAACCWRRDSMTVVVDSSADKELPDYYGRAEEMNERHAAR